MSNATSGNPVVPEKETTREIVLIDDDEMVLDALTSILSDYGYAVKGFSDPVAGQSYALGNSFDLMLVDLAMPARNGAEVTRAVRERKPGARILIISGYPEDPLLKEALAAGAAGFMRKPFEVGRLIDYLEGSEQRDVR